MDVEPGFHVTAESIASAVQVWRPTPSVVERNVRRTPGLGDYLLLTRTDGPADDGVISVTSSAVRYESTRVTRTQFAFDVEPPDVDHTRAPLSLTVVRAPYAPGEDAAASYLSVMRARLRD